jgi:cytochrome c553
MNTAMATLAKGTVTVLVVVGVVVGGVSGIFRFSPDARSEREGMGGPAAGAPAGTGAASVASGATTGAAGTSTGASGAPPGATGAAGQPPTVNLQPIAQGQATAEPARPRLGTDFSADDAPWQKLLVAAQGNAAAGQTLATAGRAANGVLACASCHGAAGVPDKSANFPALAGLSPDYLAKQMSDFRSGSRNNAVMTQVARALTDADIGALAVYYAGLAPPPLTPAAARPADADAANASAGNAANPASSDTAKPAGANPANADTADRGRYLHEFGDNALALAACANCHGARGAGEGPLLPRLAGQPKQYLLDQLEAFRSGQRRNDDVGTMQAIAKRLNGTDSEAVATFYSSMAAPR